MTFGRVSAVFVAAAAVSAGSLLTSTAEQSASPARIDIAHQQVPSWSKDDLNFFLHGSMSTEVVPEAVLRAFIKTYPDLFPTNDLTYLGMIPDKDFGWPIGFSRKNVQHLGGMSAIGINCASCHVAQISSISHSQPIQILGVTSHFNVEGFFGSVLVATFKTSDPENMKRFLRNYVSDTEKVHGNHAETVVNAAWKKQEEKILAIMKTDPFGANDVAPGDLHKIDPADTKLDIKSLDKGDVDLAPRVHSMLKLFHNMRAALHVPDKPPEKVPPASGPGRNDAFGLLSASLLNSPTPYAPIKFGLVWNVDKRTWVHWDGNTKSPIARNLLASLGLGAPIHGTHGDLIFADVKRQTDLSEKIAPPKYPFNIDNEAAKRGEPLFASNCNSCHGGPESDKRLFAVADIGTDPHRAEMFSQKLADGFNKFLAELESEGYRPPKEYGVRSTGKYWAATLSGVWARSPYLHNGSVRTMHELLTAPDQRAKAFHRGSRVFDEKEMGYTDEGAYVLHTASSGNSNSGHDYGTKLSESEKRDLLEYFKTL
jgi:processive rubber oxygenase RoxA-like protein